MAFVSPYNKGNKEFAEHHDLHGDAVRDVAFRVENCKQAYERAMDNGAISVREPETIKDENGEIVIATIKAISDTVHTFIERTNYKGTFLPGFKALEATEPFDVLGELDFNRIDHIVQNHPVGEMESSANWYEKVLEFHRFWSIDDKLLHTEYSALNSVVVADYDEIIKMPQNEPAVGKRKSQIQEYVDYYNSSGVQHVAINVNDILGTIEILRKRGCQFLDIPASYYESLRERMKESGIEIEESLEEIQRLKILVDFDEKGYLLQLFTKNLQDRPTFFVEYIQRHNNNGFGAGNFKALFEAIEREQAQRGNL